MLRNKGFILWISFTAVAAIVAGLALPASGSEGTGLKVTLGLSLTACLLQIGALVTFSSSLRTFTRTLRRAYYLLLMGFLIFAVVLMGLPLLVTFNVDSPLIELLTLVLYLGSVLVIYISMRKFAQLLKIHHFAASLPVVVGAALTLGAFGALGLSYLTAFLIGREPIPMSAFMGIIVVFLTAATFIAKLLYKAIGTLYSLAMRWLYWGLLSFTLATYHEIVVKLLLPENNWYFLYGISFWPYIAASMIILAASFVFKSHSATVVSYAGAKNHVDVLMSLVSVASRPQDIDKLLDEVRRITANMSLDRGSVSEKDSMQLVRLYLKIEKYLETEDPLHTFTQEELRSNLPASFAESLRKVEVRSTSA